MPVAIGDNSCQSVDSATPKKDHEAVLTEGGNNTTCPHNSAWVTYNHYNDYESTEPTKGTSTSYNAIYYLRGTCMLSFVILSKSLIKNRINENQK